MQDQLIIDVPVDIYSLDDVNKAAYWFTDSCDVQLEQPDIHTIRAVIWPRAGCDVHTLRRRFQTALIEERLRRTIDVETGEIRRRLWAAALREALPPAGKP